MAELTFKSAGVATREIDLSGPTTVKPQGTPAGVIGTALKGRAFVPITFATYQDFVAEFGTSDGEKFGPLAVYEWMKNSRAGTYVRTLGAGDAARRREDSPNEGSVTNAGFQVGAELPQEDLGGFLGPNAFAGGTTTGPRGEELGRTYFLGCLTKETTASDQFSDAGINVGGTAISDQMSAPILRGVLLAPSGVLLSLSSSYYADGLETGHNQPSAFTQGNFGATAADFDGGYMIGSVNKAATGQQFVMILNGHINTPDNPNILTASFDPQAPDYFRSIFNADPGCVEEAGHCLYTSWDVYKEHATAGATGICNSDFLAGGASGFTNIEECAFLVTGSLGRNEGHERVPNTECFEDRYKTARSPWLTSQKFGGKVKNLFKVHALDDGTAGSDGFKISISGIAASSNESTDFGTFDLFVRAMEDDDDNVIALEKFYKLDLNPSSERYVGRVIGDQYTYYDFDKPDGSQKLVIEGIHPNRSKYIRLEMAGEVDKNTIDDSALPVGFRGHSHLVTSGEITDVIGDSGHVADSLLSSTPMDSTRTDGVTGNDLWTTDPLGSIVQMPVPFRGDITRGSGVGRKVGPNLHWGVQFQVNDSPAEPNKSRVFEKSIYGFTKYFPDFQTSDLNLMVGDNAGTPDDSIDDLVTVLDSDRFNNNAFSLESIEVQGVDNDAGALDNKKWEDAVYRRGGVAEGNAHTDALSTGRLFGGANFQADFTSIGARKHRKFSLFLQGGFDGVNILDHNKSKMTDLACRREMQDSQQQGGVDGPTVASYRKALDVMAEKADVDIKLLAIPGLRDPSVSEYAIDTCEDRFDAMLIMDVVEVDDVNAVVENKATQVISVSNTVENLLLRNLDTSFAAAYFPDCVVPDPKTRTNVLCPPSVAVLGAFALNDAVAHPWFAPAGFTRGALARVVESQVKLNRANLDTLYEADINPLSAFPHTPGVVVWGQKTLQSAKSALDRVNVRRLLIEIRRQVKRVGNTLLFEPNRAETLARFSNAVNPILGRIQQQQGLDKFKVVIDTTTTTQADVENNTVRGKIFLQPTRTVEFISLDFVVTNAGMEV